MVKLTAMAAGHLGGREVRPAPFGMTPLPFVFCLFHGSEDDARLVGVDQSFTATKKARQEAGLQRFSAVVRRGRIARDLPT